MTALCASINKKINDFTENNLMPIAATAGEAFHPHRKTIVAVFGIALGIFTIISAPYTALAGVLIGLGAPVALSRGCTSLAAPLAVLDRFVSRATGDSSGEALGAITGTIYVTTVLLNPLAAATMTKFIIGLTSGFLLLTFTTKD